MAVREGYGGDDVAHNLDPISQMFDSDQDCPPPLRQFIERHLTLQEMRLVWNQFQKACIVDRQVLWTGMPRESAQKWADRHKMQTLATAMGPYMDPESHLCPKNSKSPAAWTEFIHGASAIFAIYITKSEVVTVLSNPPDQRFHPCGNTSFQCIEAPIVTGEHGNRTVGRIEIVHPLVAHALDFSYQFWPEDDVLRWMHQFGDMDRKATWRRVKIRKAICSLSQIGGTPIIENPERLEKICFPKKNKILVTEHYGTSYRQLNAVPRLNVLKDRHKKERAALEAEYQSKRKVLGRMTRSQREHLQQEESEATKRLKGHPKAEKRAAHLKYENIRQQLSLKRRQDRNDLDEEMATKRAEMKERHRLQIRASKTAQEEQGSSSNANAGNSLEGAQHIYRLYFVCPLVLLPITLWSLCCDIW